MSHSEHEQPILRTSPARTAKMLAILLGIMIVGAAIFFSMWDFWISLPPAVSRQKPATTGVATETTGETINVSLKFI